MSAIPHDQEAIERDLDATRSRIDRRLTQLQERLTPGQVIDDLLGYLRSGEGGDLARNLLSSARANPLPVALTGIGLTWLIASEQRPAAAAAPALSHDDDRSFRLWRAEGAVVRAADEHETAYHSRLRLAQGTALGVDRREDDSDESFGERVREAVDSVKQSVGRAMHDMRDQAAGAVDKAGKAAGEMIDAVTQKGQAARQAGSNLASSMADNPVLLGAVGVAIGAVLAAVIPRSQQETAALSGIADELREKGAELAQDVVDAGTDVARKVADAGAESAREHGLTDDLSLGKAVSAVQSGGLAQGVREIAADVLDKGEQAIRDAVPKSPDGGGPAAEPGQKPAGGQTAFAAQGTHRP